MVGDTVSHYKILEKLGEGGMGVVYKAHDIKLDRTVALKFLPDETDAGEEGRQRFMQEGRAAAKLNHPNICGIHSVGEHEERRFIEMEYVEGQTLREKMRAEELTLDTVIDYAMQAADALAAAHRQGIIHRDIKPENIMVNRTGNIKIMDFGLAKLKGIPNITKTGSTVGTTAYMSPEQILGREVDLRSDLFSFGIVLYELLTGRKPFQGEHEAAMMYAIVNEEPGPITDFLPDASPDLIHLIGRLLEKEPDDRYQSAADVKVELKRVRKNSLADSLYLPARELLDPGNKGWIGLSIALATVILFMAGWYLFIPDGTGTAADTGQSIAVLPFENLSPNPDDSYFADGIHEDIITQLTKIDELKVIARSSVMHYPVGERDYGQIASDLNVSKVIEGSIRRAGDDIRVSVQLIDLQTKQTLWADSYERKLSDIFAIQSEIAREITESLQVNISEEVQEELDQPLTDNPRAYEMFQRGREYQRRPPGFDKEYWEIAIDYYSKAIEVDPDFLAAITALADLHALYYWYGYDQTPERLELAKKYVDRARELAPDAEQTNYALASYYYHSRNFGKALSYANQTSSYELKAWIQRRLGMWEQSNENLKKEIERNPLQTSPYLELALSYRYLREFEKAITYLDKTIELAPDHPVAKRRKARIYFYWKGDTEPLRAHIKKDPTIVDYYLLRDFDAMLDLAENIPWEIITLQASVTSKSYLLGFAHHYLGNSDKAAGHFEEAKNSLEELLSEQPDDYRILASLSLVYAYLNQPEDALRAVRKVREMRLVEKDALASANKLVLHARVHAILGNAERALELIRQALAIPSRLTVHDLDKKAVWDPIRNHLGFRNLVEERLRK